MSSIFQQVKEGIDLLSVISFYTEDELRKSGDQWYEMSDKSCPLCGHNDCFKVFIDGTEEGDHYHCFSCEAHGDAIEFVANYLPMKEKMGIEKMDAGDAAKRIAADFKINLVFKKMSTPERLFKIAAEYYHNQLIESKAKIKIDDREYASPLEYQTVKRHHKAGTLIDMEVGYSDGNLCAYLLGLGIDQQDIVSCGLGKVHPETLRLHDFLPAGSFIYPHFKDGVCCHFTQKDPHKKHKFQLAGKHRLNGIQFYNEDAAKKAKKVYVVEGENDLLSLLDKKADGAVLCTDGSISSAQLKWMEANIKEADIVTVFDADDAGDKYREKVAEVLPRATHIRIPEEYNDVDNFLLHKDLIDLYNYVLEVKPKEVIDVGALLDTAKPSVSISTYDADSGILEKDGSYFKVESKKDSPDTLIRLTDFTIKLRNIYFLDGKRVREIEVRRNDGQMSDPIVVDSDTKVSVKAFRSRISDACDGAYYGSENDLINLWKYVYKRGAERLVDMPDHVGDLSLDRPNAGWLFENVYIKRSGEVIYKDKHGVMWVNGNTKGVKPRPINASSIESQLKDGPRRRNNSIPHLCEFANEMEAEAIEKQFVENFTKNLGNIGDSMLFLGWAAMCPRSTLIFDMIGSVPFIFLWGQNGSGKSTILRWLLNLYDMSDCAYFTLPSLGSTVGLTRKMAYYSGLPVCVDEIRISPMMKDLAGKIRAWYNRTSRDIAAAGSQSQVFEQPVRSVLLFGGQDMFTDQALRERCIVLRLLKIDPKRDMSTTYPVISALDRDKRLSMIGAYWIMQSLKEDPKELEEEITVNYKQFLAAGPSVSNRTAWTWAVIGTFAKKLSRKYYPDFDIDKYLIQGCLADSRNQSDNSTLNVFYDIIEGMMIKDHSPFTCEHFKVVDNELYVWINEVHRLVSQERRDSTEETFTKEAIRTAIKEEDYFTKELTVRMGKNSTSRRVIAIDLSHDKCPQAVKNIADVARSM